MTVGTRGLKDGLGTSYLQVGQLEADASQIGETELASSAVTTAKVADNAITRDKLSSSFSAGHFTLGTNGAAVYAGFSGGGVAVSVGSPMHIGITPLAATNTELYVVDYSTSGFTASGNAAVECSYFAFEEDL